MQVINFFDRKTNTKKPKHIGHVLRKPREQTKLRSIKTTAAFGYRISRISNICIFLFFFFFLDAHIVVLETKCTVYTLFMGPTTTLFRKKNIKNGSHNTIHTFKNYFATVFSIFSKISCIQTDPHLLSKSDREVKKKTPNAFVHLIKVWKKDIFKSWINISVSSNVLAFFSLQIPHIKQWGITFQSTPFLCFLNCQTS